MGCDIDYYLDHDFIGITAQEFLAEFKRRITPLAVSFTGYDESPYAQNEAPKNGWDFCCGNGDFESAYNGNCLRISLKLNGEYRGWTLELYGKTLWFEPHSDFFVPRCRWSYFREMYLKGDISQYGSEEYNFLVGSIRNTLEEISLRIVPVFHAKRFMAIGDQGLHEFIGNDMMDGKSIDEALQNEHIEKEGCKLKICNYSEERPFKIKTNDVPVWICELG